MHQLQLHAAICDHEGGDGTVDTAGEKADGLAAHADGQTARTGHRRRVDISSLLADLHMDGELRLVDVHSEIVVGLVEHTTHILADLNTGHGELLVGALGLHLEGAGSQQVIVQIALGALQNSVLVLLTGLGAADSHHTEDLLTGLKSLVDIAGILGGLHIDGALLGVDMVLTGAALQAAADIAEELILEGAAIEALQDHFAQLQKNDLVHMITVPFRKFSHFNILLYSIRDDMSSHSESFPCYCALPLLVTGQISTTRSPSTR